MKFIVFLSAFSLLYTGCSSAPTNKGKSKTHLKSASQSKAENMLTGVYRANIEQIKELISDHQYDLALTQLYKMEIDQLNNLEKGFWSYLTAITHYYKGQTETGIQILEKSKKYSINDPFLKNQIRFYLGVGYYKLNNTQKSIENLANLEWKHLTPKNLSKVIKIKDEVLGESRFTKHDYQDLVYYFHTLENWDVLKNDSLFQKYNASFNNLNPESKLGILEKESTTTGVVFDGFILHSLAVGALHSGNMNDFTIYFERLKTKKLVHPEQQNWISQLSNQQENTLRLKSGKIGVLLPLSGPKEKFGKRILNGLQAAVSSLEIKPELIIKDSVGEIAIGVEKMQELVKVDQVSAIIGGLFPQEARAEFLKAKELGVFFISLSTMFLDSQEKNMLLIEVPGSVESITHHFQLPSTKEILGENGAIVYSKDEKGEQYFHSFWNETQRSNIKLKGIDAFSPNENDYELVVERILGLKFPRERFEEKRVIEQINSLYPKRNSRKMQSLSPVVDFQWVFLPIMPDAASAIIPIFKYYDAEHIKFIGGPSWRSQVLAGTSRNRSLYFFDSDIKLLREKTTAHFMPLFNENPGLLEMNAFEALYTTLGLIQSMGQHTKTIQAACGEWFLREDSLWIKKMSLFSYRNATIKAL